MIGTVGTKLESLEQVLRRLESWMAFGIALGGRRTMGSHIIFYSPVWNVGNPHSVHTCIYIPLLSLSPFSFSFWCRVGKMNWRDLEAVGV